MSIEEVKAFKDRHGTMWESRDEAELSERHYDIIEYLNANPIYGGGEPVDGTAFWLWLKEHPRVFVHILPEDNT